MISQLKKKTLMVIILLIQRKKTFILERIINYMSTDPFWIPIKFTILSSIPNCSGPNLNTPCIDYSPFLFKTCMYESINLSFSLLDEWHYSVCLIIQMQYLLLFFSARPMDSSFTPETYFLEHGLVWRNNARRLGHFQ